MVLFGPSQAAAVFRWGDVADDAAIGLAGPLRKREAPILAPDAANRLDGATAAGPGGGTAAAFPLRGRARLLGALCLWFPQHRPLPEFESRLLSAYADQLAMALENTTLFEEAENKRTQLEQVFASTSDGFLVVDLEGRVLRLNARGAHLLGVAAREMVGATASQLVEGTRDGIDWSDGGARILADLFRAPDAGAGDFEVRTGAGPRTVGWRAAPTRDLLGTAVGLTVTLRDVTREREVDRMKTDLVSVVSHELRTPLASIRGSLQLLVAEPEIAGDATRRTLLEISIKNTDRLTRLINDILDVSRIEAGRIQLHRERHRPEAFIAVAVDGIAAVAASRGVAIERAMAARPAARAGRLRPAGPGDDQPPVERHRVLPAGPVGAGLGGARRRGDRALGHGPGPRDRPRRHGEALPEVPSARWRARAPGRRVRARTRDLPRHRRGARRTYLGGEQARGGHQLHRASLHARRDGLSRAVPAPWAEAPLILVVDDETDLRELLRDMFAAGGFRVMEAGRALEAVELARRHRPDLITMDVMLPDLDGFEAVRILREAPETRETPVIMVSGVELDPDTLKTLGSTTLLTKPFTEAALFDAVRGQLGDCGEGSR